MLDTNNEKIKEITDRVKVLQDQPSRTFNKIEDYRMLRNVIFDSVHGEYHRRGSEKENFIAETIIERLQHMSDEDLIRLADRLSIQDREIEEFSKVINGQYPRSVWTPFE